MLQGVLTGGPTGEDLAAVLGRLADRAETGCLRVQDPAGATARVHLRDGRLWAAEVPGSRVALGARLVADGVLTPEALAEAELAQREELQGWRLGELLVHLGTVDAATAARHVRQRRVEALHDLLTWQEGSWRFRRGERTRGDVAPPDDLPALLAAAPAAGLTHRSRDLPLLSAADVPGDSLALDPAAFSLLCQVDGARTAGALARALGVPLAEVARSLDALVAGGLVEVRPASAEDDPDDDDPGDGAGHGPAVDGLGALARDLSALLGRGQAEPGPVDRPLAVPAPEEPFLAGAAEQAGPVAAPFALAGPDVPFVGTGPGEPGAPQEPFLPAAPEEPFLVAAPAEPFLDGAPAEPHPDRAPAEPYLVATPAEPFLDRAPAEPHPDRAPAEPYLVATPAEPFLDRAPAEPHPDSAPAEPYLVATPAEPFLDRAPAEPHPDRAPAEPYLVATPAEPFLDRAPAEPSAAPDPDTGTAPEDAVPAPRDGFFASTPAGGGTDTASLLRELSSLGLQDDPPVPARTAPRPVPAPAPKRRKGLFGR